ncbi:MAG: response regulator transcription factor [Acidobacteriota bacterium]|nr:response regulator transcription factor [Acidobacteriota bacterium]
MMRVLVVADSDVVRAGLEAMLRDNGRFQPVSRDAGFDSFAQVALLSAGSHPDVVLAEVSEKRSLSSYLGPSIEAGGLPLVLLVDDASRNELLRAFAAGARAVLRRDATPHEIFAALEAAAAGLAAIDAEHLHLLLPAANAAGLDDEEPALDALSPRESEVLALLAQGLPNKIIADRLGISGHTVKFHVSTILSKLGASSRTEAVAKGFKDGLLVL